MPRTISAISCSLAILLAMPPVVYGQVLREPTHDWATLMTLHPGEQLYVTLTDGKKVEGKLISISETTLALSGGNKTTDLNSVDILRIYRKAGRSFKKPVLIGALVGGAAGSVVGIAAGSCKPHDFLCFDRSITIPVGAGVGTIVGILTGVTIGVFHHRKALIYEAERK